MRWIGLLLWLTALASQAEGFVWEVSKGDARFYLGGTIHVLSAKDYPLPGTFDTAYAKADKTIFEADIDAMQQPAFQTKLLGELFYHDDQTLKATLSAEAYQALNDYFKSRGMDLATLQKSRPQMVYVMMMQVELMRLGMSLAGVDEHYNNRAKQDGKAVDFLETVDQQLDMIVNLGKGYESQLILQTVSEMQEMANILEQMKSAWRKGDQQKLADITLADMQQNYPELYQSLLVTRNQAWLPKLEALLDTPEVEYVLVGALHLVGEKGVLAQLQAKGYRVQQL